MKQIQIEGVIIKEHTYRSDDIQNRIEILLSLIAGNFNFNWTAPLHDIVRSLMNQVHEFKPIDD